MITNHSKIVFEMPVESLSRITGRGIMFTGHIWIGSISIGDKIEVVAPGQQSTVTVTGIVRMPSRDLVEFAEQGEEVGILFREFKLDKESPGIQRIENQYIPTNLILRGQ